MLDVEIDKYKSGYESLKNKWVAELYPAAGQMETYALRSEVKFRDLSPNVFESQKETPDYVLHADLSKYSIGTPRAPAVNTAVNTTNRRVSFLDRTPVNRMDDYSTSRSVSRSVSRSLSPMYRTPSTLILEEPPEMVTRTSGYANKFLSGNFNRNY